MTSISLLPQTEAFRGDTDSIPAHLVFSPDELVFYPKVQVHFWMAKNFHKEWSFMIMTLHKPCKVDVSLYVYA